MICGFFLAIDDDDDDDDDDDAGGGGGGDGGGSGHFLIFLDQYCTRICSTHIMCYPDSDRSL